MRTNWMVQAILWKGQGLHSGKAKNHTAYSDLMFLQGDIQKGANVQLRQRFS